MVKAVLKGALYYLPKKMAAAVNAGLKGALYYLLKKMAAAVKADFIINHQDAKASEIEKFVVVLEMHHTSLFGDATYQVNVNRQTKLRHPQSLPSDNTVAKVREFNEGYNEGYHSGTQRKRVAID